MDNTATGSVAEIRDPNAKHTFRENFYIIKNNTFIYILLII